MGLKINTQKVFNAQVLAASGSALSEVIDLLNDKTGNGVFSLEAIVSGDGTAKITYLVCSTRGGTYTTPAAASDIKTAQTAGTWFGSFPPVLAPYMKIKIEETGGAQPVTVSAWLNFQ